MTNYTYASVFDPKYQDFYVIEPVSNAEIYNKLTKKYEYVPGFVLSYAGGGGKHYCLTIMEALIFMAKVVKNRKDKVAIKIHGINYLFPSDRFADEILQIEEFVKRELG